MRNILEEIKKYKKEEIESLKAKFSFLTLDNMAKNQSNCRGFKNQLSKRSKNSFGIIAEIKKASPSRGIIREDFNVAEIAMAYEEGGAACLSVLTDYPSFKGKPEFLSVAMRKSNLPILRKDFLYDPFQIIESRALGADCILIIIASVSDEQAKELETTAFSYQMDVLLEVHNSQELERALKLKSNLIGINNRNLKNFSIDLKNTENLARDIPSGYVIVAESGFRTKAHLEAAANYEVRSFLIGESLMTQPDIREATRQLLN